MIDYVGEADWCDHPMDDYASNPVLHSFELNDVSFELHGPLSWILMRLPRTMRSLKLVGDGTPATLASLAKILHTIRHYPDQMEA